MPIAEKIIPRKLRKNVQEKLRPRIPHSKTFGSSARQTGKRIDNEREKQAIQSKIDSMTKQLMAKQGKYKLSAEKVYNQSKAGKSKVDRALKKKKR